MAAAKAIITPVAADPSLPAASFFGPGGALSRVLGGYEERPSQQALSDAVGRTLREGGVLLAEAGTGTGKTLAYLLPAVELGRRVVVSTGTKNLRSSSSTRTSRSWPGPWAAT
jgi:ATP-dependent DNA helicase DinG